jgi:putative membrane protein
MWLGGLAMLVFWGALIVGAILVVRHLGGGMPGSEVRTSPLDILKRRYASGEITREQYEQMRKDLES